MKISNPAPGPRGYITTTGEPRIVAPGETVEVEKADVAYAHPELELSEPLGAVAKAEPKADAKPKAPAAKADDAKAD